MLRKRCLYKHKMAPHPHENVKFRMEITGQFRDALTRQANKAVRIYQRPATELLNSKSEFNHPPTARVKVEKKNISAYSVALLSLDHLKVKIETKYVNFYRVQKK